MRKISAVAALGLVALLAASPIFAVQTQGRVIDSSGAGKALVKVEFYAGDSVVGTAWTDDYGNFGADVEPGTYTVVVSDGEEGGYSTSITASVAPNGSLSPPVLEVDW